MNEFYEQGFIEKCAQYGVDPQALFKFGQAVTGGKLKPAKTPMELAGVKDQKKKELAEAQAEAKRLAAVADKIPANAPLGTGIASKLNNRFANN